MKKFLLFFVLMFTMILGTSAQAIKQDRFLDETYIGVTVGYDSQVKPWNEIGITSGLRIGKFFTPQVGLEFEGQASFQDFYKRILTHRVGANALLNLNYLGGYHEQDVVEVVPFVGIGWQRDYLFYTNSMYTKAGIYLNFNLNRCLYLSVIPSIGYVLSPEMQYNVNKADLGLAVGLTYRFKNSHGTHNFALCDKAYTQIEYDVINGEVNRLREINEELLLNNERLTQALTAALTAASTTESEKVIVTDTVVVREPIFATIGFTNNSATINPIYNLNLDTIATYLKQSTGKFTIVGYASVNGNASYNQRLSVRRARAVRDALIKRGVRAEKLSIVGKGATTDFGHAYDVNRTVQIVIE